MGHSRRDQTIILKRCRNNWLPIKNWSGLIIDLSKSKDLWNWPLLAFNDLSGLSLNMSGVEGKAD